MSLLFRITLFVAMLVPIAIVVVGQHHTTARDTLRGALRRTGRWVLWSAALVLVMLLLEIVFIGW